MLIDKIKACLSRQYLYWYKKGGISGGWMSIVLD